jgi:asparagine synthase (glutamine-hydrolysing)
MPGILGIVSARPAPECEALVRLMTASMRHGPFYLTDTLSFPDLGIYAGWVAHPGSFAAGQVFFNERKDIILLFSGECFAHPETSTELKQKGHELGEAAGSWLVHFYEEQGDRFFEKLNGLFSGLLIDKRRNRTFLFNDRYGVERIYFCETKDATYFASEAKALLRILPELRTFDERGVAQFLAFGCTLEWRTLFRGVQLLPGGSVWSFESGKCQKRKYFSPETWEAQPVLSIESFESEFQDSFKRILPRYFESESKIGISLTGGLDTRMIMACLPHTESKPVCYTFSGENSQTLDGLLAARVAKACGLEHHVIPICPDFFSNFSSYSDRTVYATDGCFGILGAHEIYLNAQACQWAPVRLTGNFGSEVFRGVSTLKPVGISHDLLSPDFSRSVNASVKNLSDSKEHPVTFAAFREIPWNLVGSLAAGKSQLTFRTPYLDNELVALAYQSPERLRKSSLRASRLVRANNAVLCEIPTDRGFVNDNSGLEFLFQRFFAEATFKIDYYNSEGLPHLLSRFDPVLRRVSSSLGIFGLHKYLPYRHWLRRELAGYINDKLVDVQARRMPFWNPDLLKSMAKDHIRGRKNYVREINAVLTLEAVERLLFRELPAETGDLKHSGIQGGCKEHCLTG